MNPFLKFMYLVKEIGISQLSEYALYTFKKKIGVVSNQTPLNGFPIDCDVEQVDFIFPYEPFKPEYFILLEGDKQRIIESAEEILNGWYHPFFGEKKPLEFENWCENAVHWSRVGDVVGGVDIKWVWEPARFIWAHDLASAWLLTKDDRYVRFFWDKFEEFQRNNPVNSAPNWTSAQEVAIRALTWLMIYQVIQKSPATTLNHTKQLKTALWQLVARIPSSLGYARSQNNNHLLSETLGLIVAGSIFSEKSPKARNWLTLGFQQFNQAILNQVEPDGTYAQHSANYHRMMLQLSLLFYGYAKHLKVTIPQAVLSRLQAATRWMNVQLDEASGRLPNLGHNDGTLLLPMGTAEFRDYRSTAQAASLAFNSETYLPPGPWDALTQYLGINENKFISGSAIISSPAVRQIKNTHLKASLRAVQFHGRPAHADQLHVDIWWDGINIAQDAGTFAYNDEPPWENPFSGTAVHNTIQINGQDQMQKAGKFLWLNQAKAEWLPSAGENELTARHDGYRHSGVTHQRSLNLMAANHLQVLDQLDFMESSKNCEVTLHWLLPDWQWKFVDETLTLETERSRIEISILVALSKNSAPVTPLDLSLIRAGKSLAGSHQNQILGWASDTYGEKHAALSLICRYNIQEDTQILTDWTFKA